MHKSKPILTAAAFALVVACTGIAMANHHSDSLAARADTDGDGQISLAEARAKAETRFARMDANGDGRLSRDDRAARQARRFEQTDADGDGEISQAEMTVAREAREAQRARMRAQRQARIFDRLDSDGSGGISEAEMLAARGAGSGPGGALHRRGNRRGMGKAMLQHADGNDDQVVTREEFDAAIEARFARLDSDRSGTISVEERAAARETMRTRIMEHRDQQRSNREPAED